MPLAKTIHVVLAVLAICGTTLGCGHDSPERSPTSNEQPVETKAPKPEHHRPKPMTDSERQRMRDAYEWRVSHSTQGLKVETTPTGSKRIDLQGRFQHMKVATLNSEGIVEQTCVTTPGELRQTLEKAGHQMESQP